MIQRCIAVAFVTKKLFYLPTGHVVFRRLYLVGSPEDKLWLWLQLSLELAGLVHTLGGGSLVLGGSTCGGATWWSSSLSTSSGGCLRHQVLILGGAIYQTHLQDKPTPGYGEGPGSR
jgi:hypothetical protein